MEEKISEILKQYGIDYATVIIEKDLTGHINESFRIFTDSKKNKGYFLQWINQHIFKNIDGLMNNIDIVTQHLKSKSSQYNQFKILEIIPTLAGKLYAVDSTNEYWRIYRLIANTKSYQKIENDKLAYEGGKAFGLFMRLLGDLPAHKLKLTIPDFHNMQQRLKNFYTAIENNPMKRAGIVETEIDVVNSRKEKMLRLWELIKNEFIPARITHNDTKFNNILFDNNDHAVCIVDLDTVMPGSLLFDIGDAIRTAANTMEEDEKDISRVAFSLPVFENYMLGYMEQTHYMLTSSEKQYLAFSAQYMTFIMGLRFLTDYIDGDTYYRTLYPEHNLIRTRVQFQLLRCMEAAEDDMERIVQRHFEVP